MSLEAVRKPDDSPEVSPILKDDVPTEWELIDTGMGKKVGYASRRQVEAANASVRAGQSGVFFQGPNGELTIGSSMPEGYRSFFIAMKRVPNLWRG